MVFRINVFYNNQMRAVRFDPTGVEVSPDLNPDDLYIPHILSSAQNIQRICADKLKIKNFVSEEDDGKTLLVLYNRTISNSYILNFISYIIHFSGSTLILESLDEWSIRLDFSKPLSVWFSQNGGAEESISIEKWKEMKFLKRLSFHQDFKPTQFPFPCSNFPCPDLSVYEAVAGLLNAPALQGEACYFVSYEEFKHCYPLLDLLQGTPEGVLRVDKAVLPYCRNMTSEDLKAIQELCTWENKKPLDLYFKRAKGSDFKQFAQWVTASVHSGLSARKIDRLLKKYPVEELYRRLKND